MSRAGSGLSGNQRDELDMGTIIEFPADAASRRLGSTMDGAPREGMGTILILPVVRIERESDDTSGGRGPEEGTAPGRRRRRR
ncbi:hypothetical protein SAMN05444169_5102 [Bradyrhizobium erythrophlei]|jgi:hypothetical protein|uniref:Uncharacterized protein n=2 Tax=Bradyrhizobium erythrophlei TaxID=1437360 RepID=A0A1M5P990_9BRAD|nr:hypothetical protein SAMN05444169_5102 [Bradyrhizobium erythrophlei]